jgi:hypothetical protein
VSPSLRLGRYLAEGLLGPGGVTETYLARLAEAPAPAQHQLFALKLLRHDRVPESVYPEAVQRFLAAAAGLHEFHRPGFGRVVDFSAETGSAFIVTEYVAGLDLGRLLAMSQAEGDGRTGVPPELAGLLAAEIARLLHVGHGAKPSFPHLGLCPQNVVVTETGEVVLLDAGISAPLRALTEQAPERWRFVAPELVGVDVGEGPLGERQGVAADLYSLGALITFLVTGQPPAGADSVPTELTGVSSQLAAVVRRLLATDPEDRPESTAVLVDWLSAGIGSVRERQRLIAEALRAAEEEARRAAAARARAQQPPTIELLAPSGQRAPGKALRRLGWTFAALAGFAMLGLVLAWPGWLLQGSGTQDESAREGTHEATQPGGEPATRGPGQHPTPPAPTREQVLSRLAGRLVAETVPPGATIWVDGEARGTTFADLVVGPGSHRVALTLPGYRTFRSTVDTSRGAIIRRNLGAVPPLGERGGFVRVECGTVGKLPILMDDEETGFLCPALAVPTTVGKHMVGIFLPREKRAVSVAVTVEAGGKPATVKFSE